MIRTFWGNPGCGKTTLACKFALKNQKRYKGTVTNFPQSVPGSSFYDSLDLLGEWKPPRGFWCGWDESGIEFNNRNHKNLPKPCISFHKKHRHEELDIDCFSQSWEDIDVTLRRLSVELWYMIKVGPWTLCRRVYKRTGIDKTTDQIVDKYRFASLLWLFIWPLQLGRPFQKKFMLTYRPFYYKYFDSFDPIPCAVREPRYNPKKDIILQNDYFVALKDSVTQAISKLTAWLLSLYMRITVGRS